MGTSRSSCRLLAAVLFAIVLASCAQNPDTVAVGIGTAAYENNDAKPYAVMYRPYAEMAALAYTDKPFLVNGCPDAGLLRKAGNLTAADWVDNLKRANGWTCVAGHVGRIDCPAGIECVDGLEYHVWRNGCREAVVAFRGTDANEIGDWLTNFRWFIARPLFDQYDQVQNAIPAEIDKIYKTGCRPRRIIATGHSLGGGLAQHAAYSDPRIGYVYAFDPSPVTAFFGVPMPVRSAAAEQLGIDRIYQAGEILSLPRYLASGVFPSSQCRPRVRIVRFATVTAPSLIERHRMDHMTDGLTMLSKGAKPARLPLGFRTARQCDFAQPDRARGM
ncbi:MAG: hypothetical protein WDN48_13955 [Pseudolabrys sp.]